MLIQRSRASHRDRSVGSILENELANLNRNFPDTKFSQKEPGKIIGQRFEKPGRMLGDESSCRLTERRIIDGARDGIFDVAQIASRPKGDIQNKTLSPSPFRSRNADVGKHFELLDMDLLFANSHGLCWFRSIIFNQRPAVLAYAKPHVTNDLCAEALLQLSHDVDLGDLFQLVVQCRLQDANVKNAFAQCDGRGMRGDKISNDLAPSLEDFIFVQAFLQPESLH
jgi:hypothetical protein